MTRLKQDKVDQLLTRCQREVDEGLLPSCQVALGIDGKVEVFETFGNESNDTRYIIFSSTKAFVASAVWILIGEGKSAVGGIGLDTLADAHGRWALTETRQLGSDTLQVYERQRASSGKVGTGFPPG